MVGFDRQDPAQLRRYIEEQMSRMGCSRLQRKRWSVPGARAKKGLKARIGVGALVWDDEGSVLLVRHHQDMGWDPKKWFTPGGVIEEGELPEEAVRREVLEEVSLEVEVIALSRVNNEILVHGDIEVSTYFFQFEVKVVSGLPRPKDGEILEARWFETLPENMAFREDYVEDFEARKKSSI